VDPPAVRGQPLSGASPVWEISRTKPEMVFASAIGDRPVAIRTSGCVMLRANTIPEMRLTIIRRNDGPTQPGSAHHTGEMRRTVVVVEEEGRALQSGPTRPGDGRRQRHNHVSYDECIEKKRQEYRRKEAYHAWTCAHDMTPHTHIIHSPAPFECV